MQYEMLVSPRAHISLLLHCISRLSLASHHNASSGRAPNTPHCMLTDHSSIWLTGLQYLYRGGGRGEGQAAGGSSRIR